MNTNDTNKFFLPIAVVVAGLLIAGAVVWNGQRPAGSGGTQQGGQPAAVNVDVRKVNIEGNPFIGKADAPLTMVFWSDFQCPFCKAAEVGGIPQIPTPPSIPDIIKNYVDTGRLKLVFMDFTFLGQDSVTAALYNRSVWKLYPEKYFEWRTAMYKAQDEEGDQGFGDAASIDKLDATIAGLDAAKIAADVKANQAAYQTLIDRDRTEAQKVGVSATPSFVVGTELIAGAYPFSKFQSVIEPLLK